MLLRKLDAALMRLEYVTVWLAGLVILITMFLVTADVILRRLANSPIPGQVDFVSMVMVAFAVLCISYCYRQAGHIRMDMLQKMTRGRVSWMTQMLATLAGLFVVTAILPGTWTHFLRAWQIGDTTLGVGLPTWPSKLAVPVGLGVLWLRLVLEVWVFGRLIRDPDAEPVGLPKAPDPLEDMDV